MRRMVRGDQVLMVWWMKSLQVTDYTNSVQDVLQHLDLSLNLGINLLIHVNSFFKGMLL